jgi:nucleoside-diphosphate-sugar epimerase
MKRILLTGATGTVGTEVLEYLLNSEEKPSVKIFALSSKKSKKTLSKYKGKVEILFGDITNYSQIESYCKNIDTVIHLAAIIPPTADDKPDLANDVNVLGTKNIVEATKKYSPQAFFIYSSSVAIYGDRLTNPEIFVGDELKPSVGDEYAKTKIEAEKIVIDSGLKYTILRLSAIMGAGNHKISKLMFHMPLTTKIEITTPEDTGRAVAKSAFFENELAGKTFNLGGGENCRISYRKLLEKSFEIYGLGKLNFPEKTFAEKNFHCGYFSDGNDLEQILNFRKDNIDIYFDKVKKSVGRAKYFAAKTFSFFVKKYLLLQSEPFVAIKKGDKELINRFFNN